MGDNKTSRLNLKFSQMDQIEIIAYSDKYVEHFRILNYEWIEKFFEVEPTDEYILSNPVDTVINKGGLIYFAKCKNEIVGTFALIKVDSDTYELSKMAVTENFQGRGIGRMLMDIAIQKARELDLVRIILYSNTDLGIAITMYLNYGFRSVPISEFYYHRANIKMELILKNNK